MLSSMKKKLKTISTESENRKTNPVRIARIHDSVIKTARLKRLSDVPKLENDLFEWCRWAIRNLANGYEVRVEAQLGSFSMHNVGLIKKEMELFYKGKSFPRKNICALKNSWIKCPRAVSKLFKQLVRPGFRSVGTTYKETEIERATLTKLAFEEGIGESVVIFLGES